MRKEGAIRTGLTVAACGVLVVFLSGCGGSGGANGAVKGRGGTSAGAERAAARPVVLARIPAVGHRLQTRIPSDSRQVVAVYGAARKLRRLDGGPVHEVVHEVRFAWGGATYLARAQRGEGLDHRPSRGRQAQSRRGVHAHRRGRSARRPGRPAPVRPFGELSGPHGWAKSHWYDFDHVIAINYNRRVGTPPDDPDRPLGESKGGGIWLHMDHGSGTSACVSVSKSAMAYLLRTLDPNQHPVVVMGDRADLKA